MNENLEYDAAEYETAEYPGEFGEAPYEYSPEAGWQEARRPGPRPVSTGPRAPAYKPRPSGTSNYVTEARLQAALARVDQKIVGASNAIKTVDNRVRGVMSEQGRQGATLRKEIMDRKKDADKARADLRSIGAVGALAGIAQASGNATVSTLAPLLWLVPPETWSGSNSGSSTSGGLFGGDNSFLALAAVALVLTQG
jgi:hypothetical protein